MTFLRQALPVRLGSYAIGNADEHLADARHLQAVRQRRRQLSRMTTAFDLPLARKRLPDADYRISRKIDGEYTCLLFDDGEVITLNPGGVIRAGAPFHLEAAKLLSAAGVKRAMLGGELHVRNAEGGRTRIHDVVSKARSPKSEADVDTLCFAVFNIYDLDGKDLSMHYGEAIDKATALFEAGERVFAVESHAGDRDEVFKRFGEWVTDGVDEGIVVRSDSAGVFKIKPRHSLDVAVLGFSEGLDDRSGMLHSLLVGIVRDDEHAQILGRVGGGFSDEERVNLFKTLQARTADSDFAEVNSDRVAYRMITPGMVVEVSCLELIARTLHGSPVDRMVIEWNAKTGRWRGVRRLPLCSVRSPQFVRVRDDKTFSAADAGLQRLLDIVDIPESSRGSLDALELPKSEILVRRVGQKVVKGATMVRKLLLWATHKQEASRDFPGFVLHLTDYSPNRREPLTHDICVSDSEAQIRALLETWSAQAYVRGWKRLAEFEKGNDVASDDVKTAKGKAGKRATPKKKSVEKQSVEKKSAGKEASDKKTNGKKDRTKTTRKKAVRKKSAKRLIDENKARKKAARKNAAGKKSVRKKKASYKTISKKVAGKKAARKKAVTTKTAEKSTVGKKKTTRKKRVGKKSAKKEAARKNAAGKKTTSKKAAGKKTVRKKAGGKKTVRKKAGGKKAGGKKTAGMKAVGKKKARRKTVGKKTTGKISAIKKKAR